MFPQELRGIWWLPGRPEETVAGTLSFPGDARPKLELIGSFAGEAPFGELISPTLVHGLSTKGKAITLYRCAQTGSTFNTAGVNTATFDVAVFFIGHHFAGDAEPTLKKLSLRYDHLSAWAWLFGFSFTITHDKETKRFQKLDVSYSHPDAPEVRAGAALYRFAPLLEQGGGFLDQFDLRQYLYAEVEVEAPESFDLLLERLRPMQNLISLGAGRAVFALEGHGTAADAAGSSVKVFYSTPGTADPEPRMHPARMLFSFSRLKMRFDFYLQNWLERSDKLGPVLDLYFSTIYGRSIYLESRFLSLIQALETYHRRVFGGRYVGEDVFGELRADLQDVIIGRGLPEDAKSSFLGKISYLNDYSLRRRLADLVGLTQDFLAGLIPAPDAFVRKVTDTRNYLTHYSAQLEDKAAAGHELYMLSEQVKALLEVCFLRELGFDDSELQDVVRSHEHYSHLERMLKSA